MWWTSRRFSALAAQIAVTGTTPLLFIWHKSQSDQCATMQYIKMVDDNKCFDMVNLCFNSNILPKYFLHFTVIFYFQIIFSPIPQNQNNWNIYSNFLLFEVHMQGHVLDQSYMEPQWVQKDAFTNVTYFSWMSSLFIPNFPHVLQIWRELVSCSNMEHCSYYTTKLFLSEVHMQGHVPDQSYIEPQWVEKNAFAKEIYFSWMTF